MNIAIILLAGDGHRLSKEQLKQFIKVNNKELFLYSLDAFNNSNIDKILLVTKTYYINDVKKLTSSYSKVIDVIKGGATRQESVYNALIYIKENSLVCETVLVHDGARPLIKVSLINQLLEETLKEKACTLGLPLKDTTVITKEDLSIKEYINRKNAYRIQTPQGFNFNLLYDAHKKTTLKNATDDTTIVSEFMKVKVLLGDEKNFKVTTPEDLEYLTYILKEDKNGRN